MARFLASRSVGRPSLGRARSYRQNSEEFALLDAASQRAEQDLTEMAQALDATNHKLDALFADLERSKAAEKVTT